MIGFWKAPLLYRNPAGRLRYGKRYTNRKQRLALAKSHMKNHLNPAKQKRKRRYKKDGAKMLFAPSFFTENKFPAGFPQTTLFLRMVDGKELTKFRSSSSPKPSPPLLAHFLLRVCISAPRSYIRSRDFAYRRGCRLPAFHFRFPDILPLVWVPLFPDLGV